MRGDVDALFRTLFLDAADLPATMTLYGDRRDGVSDPSDPSFGHHQGQHIGMTKWDGTDTSLFRLFVDIRWLFPDAGCATAYHLATLQAKSEGKPENPTARKIGDDCQIYSYASGQALGAAQGIFTRVLGDQHQIVRGIDRAISDMPVDAFIYIFTRGRVAVKSFAVLGSSAAALETGPAIVQSLAERAIGRIERAFPTSPVRQPAAWWKKLFSS